MKNQTYYDRIIHNLKDKKKIIKLWNSKSWIRLTTIFIFELFIAIYFMIKLNVNLRVFFYAIGTFFGGTINYGNPYLGTLVFTTSLIGFGLIIAIRTISTMKKDSEKDNKEFLWMIPSVSFFYAIFFSVTKLLLVRKGDVTEIAKKMLSETSALGHIAFVYLLIGVFSFMVYLICSGLKLNRMENKK